MLAGLLLAHVPSCLVAAECEGEYGSLLDRCGTLPPGKGCEREMCFALLSGRTAREHREKWMELGYLKDEDMELPQEKLQEKYCRKAVSTVVGAEGSKVALFPNTKDDRPDALSRSSKVMAIPVEYFENLPDLLSSCGGDESLSSDEAQFLGGETSEAIEVVRSLVAAAMTQLQDEDCDWPACRAYQAHGKTSPDAPRTHFCFHRPPHYTTVNWLHLHSFVDGTLPDVGYYTGYFCPGKKMPQENTNVAWCASADSSEEEDALRVAEELVYIARKSLARRNICKGFLNCKY